MSLRYSFLARLGLAVFMAGLADALLYESVAGLSLALYGFCLGLALIAVRPDVLGHGRALGALAVAALLLLSLVEEPGALAFLLVPLALAVAALLPRAPQGMDAWRGFLAVLVRGLAVPFILGADLARVQARLKGGPSPVQTMALLALPLLGAVLFILLFASANPLVDRALSHIPLAGLLAEVTLGRCLLWTFALLFAYGLFRPVSLPWRRPQAKAAVEWPGLSVASVRLSLILFNLLFAIENGLDLAFLWQGAALPEGVTLADYAHRGAYPLIVTALLAGGLALVMLRPGTASARDPLLRRLLLLWVGQNMLLVASSMRRTADYIESYSLTELRLLALVWMALVALGLGLICWRLFRGKCGAWLVNANALAAGATVLVFMLAVDPAAVVAAWNTTHNREVSGEGAPIDWHYLGVLDDAALLPLIALERAAADPAVRDRAAALRAKILHRLEDRQAIPVTWSFRGARRLAAARALLARD